MANFFDDNADLQFYLGPGVDWDTLAWVTELGFRHPDGFRDAGTQNYNIRSSMWPTGERSTPTYRGRPASRSAPSQRRDAKSRAIRARLRPCGSAQLSQRSSLIAPLDEPHRHSTSSSRNAAVWQYQEERPHSTENFNSPVSAQDEHTRSTAIRSGAMHAVSPLVRDGSEGNMPEL